MGKKDIRYMVWDLELNRSITKDIYDTLGGCKNAAGNAKKKYPNKNIGVAEMSIIAEGKKFINMDGKWTELKGVSKLLYG